MKALLDRFKQHSIIYSTRSGCVHAVVDVIEEGNLSVACRPPTIQLLEGAVARNFHGGVVGTNYLASEGRSLLVVAINGSTECSSHTRTILSSSPFDVGIEEHQSRLVQNRIVVAAWRHYRAYRRTEWRASTILGRNIKQRSKQRKSAI